MDLGKAESGLSRPSLVLGSRKSKLALWQTRRVVHQLQQLHPDLAPSIDEMDTEGDRRIDLPLAELGGQGLFTAELDQAMREGRIQLAVHSLKDLPTQPSEDIEVLPILEREDPRDVLVSRDGMRFADLPSGSVVGTSSPRRASQLLSLRRDLVVKPVRGNVPTRVDKVRQGQYDAVILAAAGILRLEMQSDIADWFTAEQILPAPGQGVMAATFRRDDRTTRDYLQPLVDPSTVDCVSAERRFLAAMGGGCATPIAALGEVVEDGKLKLTARVAALDGERSLTDSILGDDPNLMAQQLAETILSRGGKAILNSL